MRLAPALVGLLAASASAQSPVPAFDTAVAQLKARVVKDGGSGLVVMVQRTEVFGVAFKVQAVDASFQAIAVKPWDRNHGSIFSYEGKATDAIDGSGRLNEEPNVLFVEVEGVDFNPKVTLKLPRRGEKPEVATVYIGKGGEAK
ncbi:MAG TPA: hypothetical protein VL181_03665 [Holophagaceae bacterium]|nr:hypothetical protein [Holophagaceae bacterium]